MAALSSKLHQRRCPLIQNQQKQLGTGACLGSVHVNLPSWKNVQPQSQKIRTLHEPIKDSMRALGPHTVWLPFCLSDFGLARAISAGCSPRPGVSLWGFFILEGCCLRHHRVHSLTCVRFTSQTLTLNSFFFKKINPFQYILIWKEARAGTIYYYLLFFFRLFTILAQTRD